MIKSIKEMNERAQHLRSKGFDEVKDFSFAFDVENWFALEYAFIFILVNNNFYCKAVKKQPN